MSYSPYFALEGGAKEKMTLICVCQLTLASLQLASDPHSFQPHIHALSSTIMPRSEHTHHGAVCITIQAVKFITIEHIHCQLLHNTSVIHSSLRSLHMRI